MVHHGVQASQLMEALTTPTSGASPSSTTGVSWQQWRDALLPSVQSLPVDSVQALMCAICCSDACSPSDLVTSPEESRRGYLERTVGTQLREGLAHVIEQMALAHVELASGKLWDSDGCLPAQFLPVRPSRLLGEWLIQQAQPTAIPPLHPLALDWDGGVPWDQLGVREQALVAFHHLDEDSTGFVDRSHALTLAAAMAVPRQRVQHAVADLEVDMNQMLTAEEFAEFTVAVAADAACSDTGLGPKVMAYYLAKQPRAEQVRSADAPLLSTSCR
jgi:hypothetical protein